MSLYMNGNHPLLFLLEISFVGFCLQDYVSLEETKQKKTKDCASFIKSIGQCFFFSVLWRSLCETDVFSLPSIWKNSPSKTF